MTESATAATALAVWSRLLRMVRLALLTVALTVQFVLTLPGLVVQRPRPDGAVVEIAVFVLLGVAGIGGAVGLLPVREPPPWLRRTGVAVLLACSLALSATLPAVVGPRLEHWSYGLLGWYGLVLLFDLAFGRVAAFLCVHAAITVLPTVLAGTDRAEAATMAVLVVSVTGYQLGVAMAAGVGRSIAQAAADSARGQEQLRAHEAAVAAFARAQEQRYAELRPTTVPLLAGLAAGELDPRAAEVRRRCGIEAARIRRLFALADEVDDPLVHELGAAVSVAERHGVSVQMSVRGDVRDVPGHIRAELLAPISEVLVAARDSARITVLRTPDQIRMSAVCAAPELPISRPRPGEIGFSEALTDGQLCVEVSWRSA